MHLFRRLGPSRCHHTEVTPEWEEKEGMGRTDGDKKGEMIPLVAFPPPELTNHLLMHQQGSEHPCIHEILQ